MTTTSPIVAALQSSAVDHLGESAVENVATEAWLNALPAIARNAFKGNPKVSHVRVPHARVGEPAPPGIGKVTHFSEVWSGKSGRAGDGEMVASLEEVYWFPTKVELAWSMGSPPPPPGVDVADHVSPPRRYNLNETETGFTRDSEASGDPQHEWYPDSQLALSGDADGPFRVKVAGNRWWIIQAYNVRGRMVEG
jgi:hypothetical protein